MFGIETIPRLGRVLSSNQPWYVCIRSEPLNSLHFEQAEISYLCMYVQLEMFHHKVC